MKKLTVGYKKLLCLTLASTFLIGGCSTTGEVKDSLKQTDDAISQANQKLDGTQSVANNNFNYDVDSVYISSTSIERKETELLPTKFQSQIQIDAGYTSMRQVADNLQRMTGYPVLLDIENPPSYVRLTQSSGTLVDLLNNLCAQTDTSWTFTNGKLVISDLQTETFFIKALPGDVQVQNQVNSNNGINSQTGGSATASSGDSSGGGTSTGQSQSSGDQNTVQNVQFNLNNSIWTNISDTVKGMLSKKGSMTVSPSTSSITITDKPTNVLKVEQFIKKQNEMLRQQVQIDVQVFTVETNAEDNYMINWNLILNGSNASFNMNGQAATGTAAKGIVPIFSPSSVTQSFTVTSNSGSLSGSQLVANALSSKTQSSLVTSAAATTLNNQPVPIQVVEQQSYVANVSTTQVAQAGTQQSVTTGQLSYGFTLNVLPTIEQNGLINLQVSLNLSSLKALKNFATTGAMVQLPDMVQRNAMQKVTMRNGDTYVTTGFDSDFNTITNVGVGSPSFWLFGGGVSAQKTRQKMVILITPRLVKV